MNLNDMVENILKQNPQLLAFIKMLPEETRANMMNELDKTAELYPDVIKLIHSKIDLKTLKIDTKEDKSNVFTD